MHLQFELYQTQSHKKYWVTSKIMNCLFLTVHKILQYQKNRSLYPIELFHDITIVDTSI